MVRGETAVDNRLHQLRQLTERRRERCDELAAIMACLESEARLTVGLQRHLLRQALTRRGVRALRLTTRSQRTLFSAERSGAVNEER